MISVQEAEQIIYSEIHNFGTQLVPFQQAIGRVLAEDLFADRDFPPFDRVTMDGIALRFSAYERGIRTFRVNTIQAAGDLPSDALSDDECIEIMTGAALPGTADTIVRYEDLEMAAGFAEINCETVRKGQNIHKMGSDKRQGDLIVPKHRFIDPTIISIAATIGKTDLEVYRLPSVAIISTGDELVDVSQVPSPQQIRRSNGYTIQAALQEFCIDAHLLHLPDDPTVMRDTINEYLLKYEVLLLSGGVSMGKFDHLPEVLEALGVQKLLHKVAQRPGKPIWFGKHENGTRVFAFPGNPVSVFMCLHRYFIPWLERSLRIESSKTYFGILAEEVTFTPALTYFLQVTTDVNENGQITCRPLSGNGSGDLANLTNSDAFLELPAHLSNFIPGVAYRLWPFKRI